MPLGEHGAPCALGTKIFGWTWEWRHSLPPSPLSRKRPLDRPPACSRRPGGLVIYLYCRPFRLPDKLPAGPLLLLGGLIPRRCNQSLARAEKKFVRNVIARHGPKNMIIGDHLCLKRVLLPGWRFSFSIAFFWLPSSPRPNSRSMKRPARSSKGKPRKLNRSSAPF